MFGYLLIGILAIVYLVWLVISIKDVIDTWKCCRSLNIPIISHLETNTIVFASLNIIGMAILFFLEVI